MSLGISLRELSRRIGRDKALLSRMAKGGRIPRLSDGSYDEVAVRKALNSVVDPARRKALSKGVDQVSQSTPLIETPDAARAAVAMITRVLLEEGVDVAGGIDFDKARTAETILKARERDLKMAERRKELVPLARVREHVSKAFIGYRQAMQRLPSRHASEMAAELGCDPGDLDRLLSKAITRTLEELSSPVVRGS